MPRSSRPALPARRPRCRRCPISRRRRRRRRRAARPRGQLLKTMRRPSRPSKSPAARYEIVTSSPSRGGCRTLRATWNPGRDEARAKRRQARLQGFRRPGNQQSADTRAQGSLPGRPASGLARREASEGPPTSSSAATLRRRLGRLRFGTEAARAHGALVRARACACVPGTGTAGSFWEWSPGRWCSAAST